VEVGRGTHEGKFGYTVSLPVHACASSCNRLCTVLCTEGLACVPTGCRLRRTCRDAQGHTFHPVRDPIAGFFVCR